MILLHGTSALAPKNFSTVTPLFHHTAPRGLIRWNRLVIMSADVYHRAIRPQQDTSNGMEVDQLQMGGKTRVEERAMRRDDERLPVSR
jgi:hypothetical protein